jgi:hypothetical protein
MKTTHKTLAVSLILAGGMALVGLGFGLSGCVADVGVEGPGVYYGGGPWFGDGPWIDGGHWGGGDRDRGGDRGGGGYIHPHR